MARVLGVHPVEAAQPVHLLELALDSADPELDWSSVTQRLAGIDRSRWQAAYDEQPVAGPPGQRAVNDEVPRHAVTPPAARIWRSQRFANAIR